MPGIKSYCSLLLLVSLVHQSINGIGCSSAMKRLYEDLFSDYNRLILPVANNKTKVTVTLGLKLGQILDLNLKQQILSTNVWVEQTWHDYKLQWEPALYEGIDMIHVPAENIWIPDIVLFNNADGNYELTLVAKARLYSNGTVVWKPPTMFRSTCEIDVEYFPFDIQTCFLRFGSWTYAGDEVELRPVGNGRKVDIGIDLSQFYKNVEWDIIDVPAYYNENYYDCCTEPYPDITFKIVIRRKMLFYLVNLILPVALMTFMTVSVFYLPADSNEKVTLSISILTSLIVFFLLMLEIIPASSLAVPLFGKYLLFTLVLVSLSACLSVYVLNIHHRSPATHSMSPRTRRIFLETLPRLLRLNRPDPRERSSLNRFRKKKIAQQLLNQSAANKVYDLAQPLAASLNLIETLHKSYDFNPKDDGVEAADDEGRYFRKYVDNYIGRLKKIKQEKGGTGESASEEAQANCKCESRQTRNCCEHNKCCFKANRPLNHCNNNNNRSRGGYPLTNGRKCVNSQLPGGRILNDDTLDMTFDYDYDLQDNHIDMGGLSRGTSHQCSAATAAHQPQRTMTADEDEEDLPSPPPPPRQLAQLSDSIQNKSNRVSSCSRNIASNSSEESVSNKSEDHACLVDKLINSIHLINNASDDIDTTTLSNNDTTDDEPKMVVGQVEEVRPFDHVSPLVLGQSSQYLTENSLIYRKRDSGMLFGSNQQQQLHRGHLIGSQQPRKLDQSADMMSSILDSHFHHHNQNGNGVNSGCACEHFQNEISQPDESKNAQPDQQGNSSFAAESIKQPSDLLMSLRLAYDQMPPHVRAAIRSILFIADTIKNEDDENSAIEDWESMSMVVDRLFLWIFFLLCTFGSVIILALAPSLYDQRAPIDDKLRLDISLSNCSANTVI